MAYDNTNRGTLAKNPNKTADTHPDIKGSINVEGKDYWLDGWQKRRQSDGSTFYSLSVKPKQARSEPPPQRSYAQESGARTEELNDDSLPF